MVSSALGVILTRTLFIGGFTGLAAGVALKPYLLGII